MNADQFAQLAAAILALCGLVAAVVKYILFGLHRPAGLRTRGATYVLLITIAVGAAVSFVVENQGTETSARVTVGVVRLVVGLACLSLAASLYQDDMEREQAGRKPPTNHSGL